MTPSRGEEIISTKKKNIYFANSKNNNYNMNIMCKHRGGVSDGQSPIVLDTLLRVSTKPRWKSVFVCIYNLGTLYLPPKAENRHFMTI